MDPAELTQILERDYELTGNPRHRVATDELLEYVRTAILPRRETDYGVMRLLTACGLMSVTRRVGTRTEKARMGVLRRVKLVA